MRRFSSALLLAPLALISCGYTPLYAPGEGAAEAAQYVQIGEIAMGTVKATYATGMNDEHNLGHRRVAQAVAQQLKLDFPASGPEADTLTARINEDTGTLAVQSTAVVQRAQIVLTAFITLTSPNGHTLLHTSIASAAPYNVQATPYSTESGKNYARLTAARNLADEISMRLALYYRTHKPTK
jgi:hypothetical protein